MNILNVNLKVLLAVSMTLISCSKEVSSNGGSGNNQQGLSDNTAGNYDDTQIIDHLAQLDAKTAEIDQHLQKIDDQIANVDAKLSKFDEALAAILAKLGSLDDVWKKFSIRFDEHLKDYASLKSLVVRLASQVEKHEKLIAQFNPDRIAKLEERLAALEKKTGPIQFEERSRTLTLSGVNVQIVNGLKRTQSKNGLGNLIIGYNEESNRMRAIAASDRADYDRLRSGSHNVVVGTKHVYTSVGGLVAGYKNGIHGPYSTVTGGHLNQALGGASSISGGKGLSVKGRYEWAAGNYRFRHPNVSPAPVDPYPYPVDAVEAVEAQEEAYETDADMVQSTEASFLERLLQ